MEGGTVKSSKYEETKSKQRNQGKRENAEELGAKTKPRWEIREWQTGRSREE